jgi:hypothetical protein
MGTSLGFSLVLSLALLLTSSGLREDDVSESPNRCTLERPSY